MIWPQLYAQEFTSFTSEADAVIIFAGSMESEDTEKLDVGYRYYDKHPEEICYPFGFGLSYTEFQYRDIDVSKKGEDMIG